MLVLLVRLHALWKTKFPTVFHFTAYLLDFVAFSAFAFTSSMVMAGKSVTWPNASPAEPEAAAGCWVENQAIAAANDAQ